MICFNLELSILKFNIKVLDPIIIRDINLGRRDGNIAMIHRPLICICSIRFVIAIIAHHPIVFIPMRVRTMFHLVDPRAMCHSASLEALERRLCREVDIQAGIFRQALLQNHLYHLGYTVSQRREISILIIVATAEGNARNVLHTSLLGYAHRT